MEICKRNKSLIVIGHGSNYFYVFHKIHRESKFIFNKAGVFILFFDDGYELLLNHKMTSRLEVKLIWNFMQSGLPAMTI